MKIKLDLNMIVIRKLYRKRMICVTCNWNYHHETNVSHFAHFQGTLKLYIKGKWNQG